MFNSTDVSKRLSLNFLYVCKLLSRLSRKPYYVLSRVRVSRSGGGFENVYSISVKGWGKIGYLLGQPASVQEQPMPVLTPQMEGSVLLGASRAEVERDYRPGYLLLGKGTVEEYTLLGIPHTVMVEGSPIVMSRPTNVNVIAVGLNECCQVLSGGRRELELGYQVGSLQMLGLTPTGTCAPFYANAARYLGATSEEIIISLLARRCVELRRLVFQKGTDVSQKGTEGAETDYESAMTRLEIRLESARELFEVEKNLGSDLHQYVIFLNELFLKIFRLESLTTDNYMKSRIKGILFAIMEFELSSLKRR